MEAELIQILTSLNYPIYRQGSLSIDDAYPDSFFTFWNNDSDGDSYYDNFETRCIWAFDLNFYSNDPALVNSKLLEAKALLLSNGWIVNGKGHNVMSDEPTHTGRGINILFIENEGGIQNA